MGCIVQFYSGSTRKFCKLTLILFFMILYIQVYIFSVMSGQVFLGWTSTKQRIKCPAQRHHAVPQARRKLTLKTLIRCPWMLNVLFVNVPQTGTQGWVMSKRNATMWTKMMRHFIRVCTVCKDKINLQRKKYNIFLEIITCDPSTFTMDHPGLTGSNFMRNSIGPKRDK